MTVNFIAILRARLRTIPIHGGYFVRAATKDVARHSCRLPNCQPTATSRSMSRHIFVAQEPSP